MIGCVMIHTYDHFNTVTGVIPTQFLNYLSHIIPHQFVPPDLCALIFPQKKKKKHKPLTLGKTNQEIISWRYSKVAGSPPTYWDSQSVSYPQSKCIMCSFDPLLHPDSFLSAHNCHQSSDAYSDHFAQCKGKVFNCYSI